MRMNRLPASLNNLYDCDVTEEDSNKDDLPVGTLGTNGRLYLGLCHSELGSPYELPGFNHTPGFNI